ncbi:MAG TPA: long-chain fatty acid--CoA ligase, partial [Syntrophomonas sp.]|nr:long-chain fatty acid--CoA ligase [Syntrophomonas sp.]
ANNRVEWAVADYAAFTVRAASVPVYATTSAAELKYIVNHAEIRILFAGNQDQYDKALTLLGADCPTLEKIIVFDKIAVIEKRPEVMYFDDFLAMGRQADRDTEMAERIARLDSEDLSTLIYTSGTTGTPKAVMLTHKGWFAMLFGTGYHIPIIDTDVNLAFLPLSHVFERAWSYFILCGNGQVDYCHDTKAINQFLLESRPHYMCSVPRMWEKIYATIQHGISMAPPEQQQGFKWALAIGGQYETLKKEGKPIPEELQKQYAMADEKVLKNIRNIFGGRNKVFNCGGAAFSGEIAEFFFNAGVLLLQGYGMTECFVITVANPEHNKFGTCGPIVPLMDVKFSPEGEILAKGPSMMKGYYKDPELTRESLTEDGYMKTGDVGFIDEEGYLSITDRIKDLMKTSGGKYIAPQHIETLLKEDFYIDNAATIGDGRKYVSALISPSFEPLEAWAKAKGLSFASREELVKMPEVNAFYRELVDNRTKDLGQVEQVKKFTVLPNEFSQETGELTATMKIKRKAISEKYADVIEAMYVE